MTLPAPNLDDRRFQDLVDEAKRLVQQRCPEWTDHNVSDPGVTLIETFAFMTDQLLFRLNRVPDRLYIKFLDLMGIRLFPPTAAKVDVTFWLSATQEVTIDVPAGTEVSTLRTPTEEAVSFTVLSDLAIVPCSRSRVATALGPQAGDQTDRLEIGDGFPCFDAPPKPGDALLIGLSNPVPSCAVLLELGCRIEGVGVDPRNPPIAWEAWDGRGWAVCELERDTTGGLNKDGEVVLHVPASHQASQIAGRRAGWLRCRVTDAEEGQPVYSAPPFISRVAASTIGGTTVAVNAEIIEGEVVATATGGAGQRYPLRNAPVVPGEAPVILEVSEGEGWEEWAPVDGFAHSGPHDRHFQLDAASGEIAFGPAVREPDGSLRRYGAAPGDGAVLRVRSYRTGGGRRGNVARGAISVLRTTIPFVGSVVNRRPASGGVDGEDLESAKLRGPLTLRTRDRAVTAEDYEQISLEAAPEVARVRCAPAGNGADPGAVRVLVVPAASEREAGRLEFEQLVPSDETLARVAGALDERRVIGSRLVVEPPVYQGITVVARLRARRSASVDRLRAAAVEALYGYFHPISGGPDGTGWPFGRPIHAGEVYAVLQRLPGVELVDEARLYPADPITGRRGEAVQRLAIDPHALVFSYGHQVLVEPA
ncbi:MAG TPA: putative baseplate assembly protein [Actinomycetota bacterium]|nr:putative baseplate assembly protein [Actinomycetota bacterium]